MQACTPPRKTNGFFANKLSLLGLGVVVVASLLFIAYSLSVKDVTIIDKANTYKITAFRGTVSDALKQAKIKLNDNDVVKPELDTELKKGLKITVTRAINVKIVADGNTTTVSTPISNVAMLLKEQKIELGPLDKVQPELGAKLAEGDTISITRVNEKTITEEEVLPYRIERARDNKLYKGVTRVVSSGKDGLKQKTIKVTIENGKEVKREVIDEKVVKEPVNKVVAVGTITQKTVSRGGSIRFSEVITMSATGYTYTGNNTYSGTAPSPGTVAVDPSVIPLGTKLYVDGYGYATALDIGSAIKGKKIDLFFETRSQALRWGRRNVKVYILK